MPIGVPSALAGLLGLEDAGESWEDRIAQAAYRSPKGTRIRFDFEDVSREVEARGTAWEFPGVDGAYIQRTGFGARQYPLRAFFSGATHDRIADAFLAALLEPGTGQLEHPRYGTMRAVPFGKITQRDDLKTAANQTVIEVAFFTTLGTVYPSGDSDAQNEILAALGNFDVEAAQQFSADTNLLSAASRANLKGTVRGLLRDISGALQSVSDSVSSVRREFADTVSTINYGIDVLVGQPLLLARQVMDLINAPARAIAGIQSRLEGYADLADRIFGSDAGRPGRGVIIAGVGSSLTKTSNDFHAASLVGMSAVSGTVRSSLSHEFATKPEALEAAAEILGLFDEMVAWRDGGFADIGQIDTGGAYQALHQAVSLTAGKLIDASFTLVPERRIVLDRPRTIVDLAAELYGSVDDRLDFLIASNKLTGSEILELPRGKMIAYYDAPSPR